MKQAVVVLTAAVAVFCLACTTSRELSVRTEALDRVTYPADASFFVLPTLNLGPSSAPSRRAQAAVRRELQDRGFQVVEPGQAEFDVAVAARFSSAGLGAGQQYSKGGSFEPGAQASSLAPFGVLTIEIRKHGATKPLWRGSATGLAASPVKGRDQVTDAVHRILAEFPPIGR